MADDLHTGTARPGDLEGRVALITGSARGVGEATARLFAAEGAKVVVSDVLDDLGRAVADDLGDAAVYVRLDVTDESAWTDAVATACTRFGALDVLVNNAAVLVMKSIADTSLDDFRRLFEVNQAGTFLGVRTAAPVMAAQGRGSIVNVSSVKGMHGLNGLVAYSATKYAMRGISAVAALELGRDGIRVNTVMHAAGNQEMVQPWVATDVDLSQVGQVQQRPLARPGRVEETAEAILYLASDRSSYCTGTELVVDGGELAGGIIPGFPGART